MNLSCENCKVIRPFSGVPPTCEACGWILGKYSNQSRTASRPQSPQSDKSASCLLSIIAGAFVIAFGAGRFVRFSPIHSMGLELVVKLRVNRRLP